MAVKVNIPVMLRQYTAGLKSVEAEGSCVRELIENIDVQYPGFESRMCTGDGKLLQPVSIFVNGEDIKTLSGIDTPVGAQAGIHIILAIAGG